jgi:hypothetical protein
MAVAAGRPGPADRILPNASSRSASASNTGCSNLPHNAGHPEVVSGGTVVGMALGMFADRRAQKTEIRTATAAENFTAQS